MDGDSSESEVLDDIFETYTTFWGPKENHRHHLDQATDANIINELGNFHKATNKTHWLINNKSLTQKKATCANTQKKLPRFDAAMRQTQPQSRAKQRKSQTQWDWPALP